MTITDTPQAVVPFSPKEKGIGSEAEIVDRAGNAILGLVSRAADTAAADLKEAREAAEKLADQLRATRDQLRAAHDQINALKADVGRYQDRANRAEKWLHQISSEIEQRFFDATGRQQLIQAQVEIAARNVTPPVEELIKDETQRIAAKFAPIS
jgi:DNA repair exonuclease SbcCD ATPase subunit